MKRPSRFGDAGADGGCNGSRIAIAAIRNSYERRRTYGPEPRRRVGMTRGGGRSASHNPIAKSEAAPPRPFFALYMAHGDSRSASRPPFACAFGASGRLDEGESEAPRKKPHTRASGRLDATARGVGGAATRGNGASRKVPSKK